MARNGHGEQRHDIILWGATGFTGRLVAEHYASGGCPAGVRWALAGRSLDRLEGLRRELAAIDPAAAELELVLADSNDPASLQALARRARVVCSTVGPYQLHGSELVRACVEAGTSYCDLTGEVHWMRQMIERHHERARETGARIVHACGFDSIPSDLGCWLLQRHARRELGQPCRTVAFYLMAARGGFSGGTAASMLATMEAAADPSVARVLADPYALSPDGSAARVDGPDQRGLAHDRELGCWTGPFIMAGVNTRVVRRTAALLDADYGAGFRYREASAFCGRGGLARAAATTAGTLALMTGVMLRPTRSLLKRFVLPGPGQGPDRAAREAGYFEARLLGQTPAGERVQAAVAADGDPGYKATATMLGQSALCLALDGERLSPGGGVLTPAASMGEPLLERLRRAGMTFTVAG